MSDETLHCTYCGTRFAQQRGWPRTCALCARTSFKNPLPVVVALVPLRDHAGAVGLLVVRRSVAADPGFGQFALPGGYIDINDASWQHAAARELREETGIELSPGGFREYRVRSAPNGTLLLFVTAPPIMSEALESFRASDETSEISVITGPTALAFDLHSEVAGVWFDEQNRRPRD